MHRRISSGPYGYARMGPGAPRNTWPKPRQGSFGPCTVATTVYESSSIWGSRPSALRTRDWRPSAATTSRAGMTSRSEEHTSELQSLAYLVCRLLLEKKKKKEKKRKE